jgi:hypothetical protein
MIRIITLSIILASCTSAPLDKPGIPRGTSVQDSVWVDPATLEPAFEDDTIGQAEYIKKYENK